MQDTRRGQTYFVAPRFSFQNFPETWPLVPFPSGMGSTFGVGATEVDVDAEDVEAASEVEVWVRGMA